MLWVIRLAGPSGYLLKEVVEENRRHPRSNNGNGGVKVSGLQVTEWLDFIIIKEE